MTFPIQHALLYPERLPGVAAPLDLDRLFSLDFRPVDETRYPCLSLARSAMMPAGLLRRFQRRQRGGGDGVSGRPGPVPCYSGAH